MHLGFTSPGILGDPTPFFPSDFHIEITLLNCISKLRSQIDSFYDVCLFLGSVTISRFVHNLSVEFH